MVRTLALALGLLAVAGAATPAPVRAQHTPGTAAAPPRALRSFTPEDVLNLEQLGGSRLSPDGQLVAYERTRSPQAAPTFMPLGRALYEQGTDLWIAAVAGGAPTKLTPRGVDGAFAPAWSPDGAYLAMYSVTGANQLGLWVWARATKRVTKLSDSVAGLWPRHIVWVDNRRLAVVRSADGDKHAVVGSVTAGMRAARAWQRARDGREPTASVLESGVPVDTARRPTQYLVLLDLTGKTRRLAQADGIADVQSDLSGQYIAFVREDTEVPPTAATPQPQLAHDLARNRYEIVDTAGHAALIQPKDLWSVDRWSFRWSRSGEQFAFVGVRAGETEGGRIRVVFRGHVHGRVEEVRLPDAGQPRALVWAAGDRLLVAAERTAARENAEQTRVDWWLVAPGAAPRNVTATLAVVPAELVPDSTGSVFVGVAAGNVWRLSVVDAGAWTNLTAALDPRISSVAWPSSYVMDPAYDRVVVSARHGEQTEYYRVEVASGAVTPIGRPSDATELVAYHPATDAALFKSTDRTGTLLTLVRGAQRRTLVETNTFLREIAEGQWQKITYRSLDGQALTGWVLLPVSYQSGRRYPLVTWVYLGKVHNDTPPHYIAGLNNGSFLNLELLAARGYAVLFPSMPDKGSAHVDPYMELTKGVLPAVDKVIELGIADSARLAVAGHSYGGYSTFGLVTQTTRFKAAIPLAGPSDMVSMYGQVSKPEQRYDPNPPMNLQMLQWTEGTLGNPPWKDWGRYWRNSPLFYVDRVQTPLLIIQGDWDYVPIQQGEEFFAALRRQGKRARFVRYWGEGHLIDSPANVRDMWGQIYRWLDEYLDLTRDATGSLVFAGEQVQSRLAAAAAQPSQ